LHYYRSVRSRSLTISTLVLCALAAGVSAQPVAPAEPDLPEAGAAAPQVAAPQAVPPEATAPQAAEPPPATTPASAPAAPPPAAPAPTAPAPVTPAGADELRPLPDYDGRGDDPTTAGDVLVWIPRVVLFPLYVVNEFVLRKPFGWLLETAERNQWAGTLFSLFQFGPNNEIAIVPTALIDLGFQASVGVYARWNDFIARQNKLRLHAATAGAGWIRLTVADRIESADGRRQLQLRGEYAKRPDGLYYGIGLDSARWNKSRYDSRLMELQLAFDARTWRNSSVRTFAGLRAMEFSSGTCCGDPSIMDRIEDGTLIGAEGNPLPLPPGWEGYSIYKQGLQLIVDTRHPRPAPGSGVRFGVHGEHDVDIVHPLNRSWVRYAASTGLFWDITGLNHVLHLDAQVQMISAIAGEVPFTEMIDLSDTGPMKGFVPGRILGESAAAVSLEYHWPIWVWLDGTIHIAAGNAFGPDWEGFELGAARISTGIGISAPGERDHVFTMLVAVGTKPLNEGGKIEAFRLMFGGTRTF
jgi:hypothetical protein